MWRWCLAILAFISHVLLIAVCVFWARSYRVQDSIYWNISGQYWGCCTHSGRYEFSWGYLHPSAPSYSHAFDVEFDILDLSGSEYSIGDDYQIHYELAGFEYAAFSSPNAPLRVFVVPIWFVAGILAVFPIWWLIAFRRRYRVLTRIAGGLCGACGYDLRGSQLSKCPECGTTSPLVRTADPTAPATPHE